jgi:hypothetical protein
MAQFAPYLSSSDDEEAVCQCNRVSRVDEHHWCQEVFYYYPNYPAFFEKQTRIFRGSTVVASSWWDRNNGSDQTMMDLGVQVSPGRFVEMWCHIDRVDHDYDYTLDGEAFWDSRYTLDKPFYIWHPTVLKVWDTSDGAWTLLLDVELHQWTDVRLHGYSWERSTPYQGNYYSFELRGKTTLADLASHVARRKHALYLRRKSIQLLPHGR